MSALKKNCLAKNCYCPEGKKYCPPDHFFMLEKKPKKVFVRQFYMSGYLRCPADNCPPTLQDPFFL